QTIYNPFTGDAGGTGRQPFPDNKIPLNLLDPIALKILNLYPLPNNPGIGAGGLVENYRRQENRTVDRQNYDFKVNWNRTSAQQVWAKFSHMHALVHDLPNYLGPPTDPNAGGNHKVYQLTPGQHRTMT